MRPIIHNICTDDVGSYGGIPYHPGGPLGPHGMSEVRVHNDRSYC